MNQLSSATPISPAHHQFRTKPESAIIAMVRNGSACFVLANTFTTCGTT